VVVPFLILIPALAGETHEPVWIALGLTLIKSALVLGLILLLGRWLFRPLFHAVASTRARELFMFTVLLLTLASAWLTHQVGLSAALGAFLAGMMLGETEYRHQVEADILPFRDVLLGLFFISVGMMLDVRILGELWLWVLAATAAIIVFKTLLVTGLARLFKLRWGDALRTGLVVSQVGEFAFALLLQARGHSLFDPDVAQVVLATIVLSMLAAPLIVRYNAVLAPRLLPRFANGTDADLAAVRDEVRTTREHVIICGYGRSGQNLAWMLEREGIASLALDLDPVRVRDARDAGKPVVYGDATHRDVLKAAGVEHARALAVSFNDDNAALKILEATRHVRQDMPVIVRTVNDAHLEQLMDAGATEVVPESLEGSLMMGSHLLLLLGVPVSRLVRRVRDVRRDRYRLLRGLFRGQDTVQEDARGDRLHSVTLADDAFAVGKRLDELALDRFGVTVNAVRRDGVRGPQPAPETKLRAGDVLVLYGKLEALEDAKKILMEGKQ
ncbi:MAG TPA: cation:proton antiporter, partial [Burkholderiaceae bacterium]|nr:cation:proton antiporter [Burkholderiaceae bacterium]